MYDIIGDIHGHADELVEILELMGYDRRQGHYAHPERRAVFVGDFIDRGPQIREVLQLVRPMIDQGAALAVMGNHEFNAIAYHTPHPEERDSFLRPHCEKNNHQHVETIRQVPQDELTEYVEWFKSLPMRLEIDGICVVHACWDQEQLNVIDKERSNSEPVTTQFMVRATDRESDLYKAIDDVLKGKEIKLPGGVTFLDKDGNERSELRVRWFESPDGKTYAGYALSSESGFPEIDVNENLITAAKPYPRDAPPVFFGHYWLMADKPSLFTPNVACVDWSVAKGGKLVAYRWDGEQELDEENFVSVISQQ
jgi:hypothetical protein